MNQINFHAINHQKLKALTTKVVSLKYMNLVKTLLIIDTFYTIPPVLDHLKQTKYYVWNNNEYYTVNIQYHKIFIIYWLCYVNRKPGYSRVQY